MPDHEINEPLFITKEVEAEMIAAGYVFEVPPMITLGRDHAEQTPMGGMLAEPESE